MSDSEPMLQVGEAGRLAQIRGDAHAMLWKEVLARHQAGKVGPWRVEIVVRRYIAWVSPDQRM